MKSRRLGSLLALLALGSPLIAQRPAVTTADYARAEKFLGPNLTGLVAGGSVAATWLPDERFWYRNQPAAGGTEIVVVDPSKKTRTAYADCAAAGVDCTAAPADTGGRGGRGRGGGGGGGGGAPLAGGETPSGSPGATRAASVGGWEPRGRATENGGP